MVASASKINRRDLEEVLVAQLQTTLAQVGQHFNTSLHVIRWASEETEGFRDSVELVTYSNRLLQ